MSAAKAGDDRVANTTFATYGHFIAEASLNPNASKITGTKCGYQVEETETTRQDQPDTWIS